MNGRLTFSSWVLKTQNSFSRNPLIIILSLWPLVLSSLFVSNDFNPHQSDPKSMNDGFEVLAGPNHDDDKNPSEGLGLDQTPEGWLGGDAKDARDQRCLARWGDARRECIFSEQYQSTMKL